MAADNIEVAVKAYTEEVDKGFRKAGKAVDNFGNKLGSNINKVKKFTNLINEAFSLDNIAPWAGVIKNATNQMIALTKAQVNYNKNMQKLQVAYGQVNSSGEKLIKTMSDISGLDEAELTKSLGTFRQYASTLGIVSDKANMLSENLLKVSNDLASFYGEDTEDMARRLISAMTGETEALKVLGADVSDNAIKQKALSLGVQENTSNMSAASKAILRYLLVVDQLKNAQGNFAKTINDVSNQTKIWNAQINTLKRQLGAFLVPILQTILPVLNGIIMVVNELLGMLLGLFGIKIPTSSIVDDLDNINAGLNGVSSSAKEAKKSLRGFDKLNVITTPTASTTGTGGGIGGVDNKILDAMEEYNDLLAEAHNKATKIRDDIMEWLGFTKDANGEWKWTNFTIGDVIAGLGLLLITIKSIKSVWSVINFAGKLLGLGNAAGTATTKVGGLTGALNKLPKGVKIGIIAAGLVSTATTVKKIIDEKKQLEDDLEVLREKSSKIYEENYGKETDINVLIEEQNRLRQVGIDALSSSETWYNKLLGLSDDYLENAKLSVKNSQTTLDALMKQYDTHKLSEEEQKKILGTLIEQYNQNLAIIGILEQAGIDTTELKDITAKYGENIDKVSEGLGLNQEQLNGMITKSSEEKDLTKDIYKNIDDINKTKLTDKSAVYTITAKANTAKAAKDYSSFFGNIGTSLGLIFDPTQWGKGFTKKLKNIWSTSSGGGGRDFADGGFPKQGELFIAREAGAEMVGSINNKTAVANNDQIVDGISAGVAKAIMATGRNVNVNITAEGDTEGLLDFITFKQKQKDRQYGF